MPTVRSYLCTASSRQSTSNTSGKTEYHPELLIPAYTNSDLFMGGLVDHFIPQKPAGKCLLIVDGQAAHMNSYKIA
jgi:phosphatidate phosphatase PAH1